MIRIDLFFWISICFFSHRRPFEIQVKQLGISNIYDVDRFKQLWQDSYVKPSIIQNRFYADSGFDVELRAFCRENGVIYTSFWTLTANPEALRSQRLLKIAQRVQKTPAQVWFRFVMHLGIVPLTGTCDPKHMAEDLVVRDFELTLAEVQSLAELVGEPDVDELRDQ
jgi:diketogulonate reductase-like aldo/keto reductase